MSSNIFESILLVTDSLAGLSFAKLFDQALSLSGNPEGDGNRVNSLKDFLVNVHVVVREKGCFSRAELENQNSEGPKIGADVVTAVGNDLKRKG